VSAIRVVQTAIYAVLVADSTLAALATGGIHNDVPDGQAYPHVLISRASVVPWHTCGGASSGIGWNTIIRLHIYSRYQGETEALQISEQIAALLNFQALTVTGYPTALVALESSRVMVEAIEKIETRHLVDEYRVRVHQ